jgi:hypothetical protein
MLLEATMKTLETAGGAGKAWWCAVLGLLACSGESAVVGGNRSQADGIGGAADGGGGSSQSENLGKVRRLISGISSRPGLCLPSQLPLDADGTAACKVFTTSAKGASCVCDAPNRVPVTDAVRAAVLGQAKSELDCDQPEGPACPDLCVCEDLEAVGSELTSCLSGQEVEGNGWCYVAPAQGIGALNAPCPSEPQAQVRFMGNAAFGQEERGFMACSDASESQAGKRPLGAVCVPSDELSASFPGFRTGEIVVDMSSTSCASGTCLVEGFQGRVSCPLGSKTSAGADRACVLPTSNQRVSVDVAPQLVSRPPSVAATCSCRCAGPGDGPFCTCEQGQECVPLVADLGLPGDHFAGSYCVPRGALTEPTDNLTCADVPERCSGDRPY